PLLRVAAVAVLCSDLFNTFILAFQALRSARATVRMALAKAIIEFAAVVTLITLGFGALGAILGNALGYGSAVLVAFLMLRNHMRGGDAGRGVGGRQMLSYGSQLWIADLSWIGFATIDQLLLGAFLGTTAVGVYDAPWRFATVLSFAGLALGLAVGPRMAAG